MVASTIAELYRDTDAPTIWDVMAKFQAAFRVDNPRFDDDRFRKAALAYSDNVKEQYKPSTYEPGDYLLLDANGIVQAVSGNSDFWDDDEAMPTITQDETHTIVKVMNNA
jgi:hypothetical protein